MSSGSGRVVAHSSPTAEAPSPHALRYLTEDGKVRPLWLLKNGRPAHVLSREDRARGGRIRAANARERKASLRNDHRSSERLVEAAQRLGEMLRSENLRTAMWADQVVSKHILGTSSTFER